MIKVLKKYSLCPKTLKLSIIEFPRLSIFEFLHQFGNNLIEFEHFELHQIPVFRVFQIQVF